MKNNKIFILLLLMGIIVLFYPFIGKFIHQKKQSYVIEKYDETMEEMSENDYKQQKEIYERYNENISKSSYNESILKDGAILGYIRISKINVNLPFYEGTSSKILEKAVGHLENTSMPINERDYHIVLVGHTGLTTKKIFDDLEKLKIGDTFEIIVLKETYKYRIYDIKTVLPNQTDYLKIQSEKQLATLVTCTPKYVNSHRLLVMGEFIN